MTQNEIPGSGDVFGKIRAMVREGRSRQEVEKSIAESKRAHGVNPKDEEDAIQAIRDLSEPLPGVAWIESKTVKTSPIIDRIWGRYHTIVILLPESGIFVTGNGTLITWLCDYYDKKMEESSYQKGGDLPDCGFFESTARIDEEMLLQELKNRVKPISQHIFLFPFIASPDGKNSPIDMQKQTQSLFDELVANDWEPEPFKVFECRLGKSQTMNPSAECCLNYDEYAYFHEYVRKALFTFKSYDKDKKPAFYEDSETISYFFRYPLTGPSTFQIDISRKFDNSGQSTEQHYPYRLAIRGITLRLFKTGVAILGFELHNYCYDSFEEIQRINDYGRRVYPQFIEEPSLKVPKEKFLADAITIEIPGKEPIIETFKFEHFTYRKEVDEQKIVIGSQITKLLGDDFCEKFYVEAIIDDRMFTLCWYANQELINNLTIKSRLQYTRYSRRLCSVPTVSNEGYPFETAEAWYRFVFIDGDGCNCPDDMMKQELLAATTYRRWASWGTLYGISRYSLMCLTTPVAPPFIREHMRRHYRQMAELLLAQRASMIVFSNRISKLSGRIDDLKTTDNKRNTSKEISKEVRTLHGDYIGFVNRLWFEEVTPQEQGIEMYDIAVRNMRLKEQMQELKAEIKELYEFMEMQESNAMNKTMLTLTRVASIGIPVTVFLSFWGISKDFVESISANQPFAFVHYQGWCWVIGSLLVALGLGCWIQYKASKEEK